MRKPLRTYKKLHFVVLLLILLVLGLVSVWLATKNHEPNQDAGTVNQTPAAEPTPEKKRYGYPVKLKIPKIGVDAKIQYVGLTDSGDLDVPSNYTDVGWYKLGVRPGNPGSAVMDGHLSGRGGLSAVFLNLEKLKKDDKVTVIDNKGETIVFSVTKTKKYSYDERPDEVFKSQSGTNLNLITCAGDWSAAQRNFSKRTVVFTTIVNQ